MAVSAIPEGYHSVTPYLVVDGAAAALDWYARAFGATELLRMPTGSPMPRSGSAIRSSCCPMSGPT